jgi:hypothetical protein
MTGRMSETNEEMKASVKRMKKGRRKQKRTGQ